MEIVLGILGTLAFIGVVVALVSHKMRDVPPPDFCRPNHDDIRIDGGLF